MFGTYPVSDLRKAYNKGGGKTGRADVRSVGLTYCGKRIDAIQFDRNSKVTYLSENGEMLGVFQDVAAIDD